VPSSTGRRCAPRRCRSRIELAGSWSRGRTIVDRRGWSGAIERDPHGEAPVRVEVALGVDGERYARLWRDTLLGRTGDP
jgi:pyrimidine-specific ribonucleoside hydrolase